MGKKQGKRVITKIPDSDVWDSFLEHINSVHGKTYGHIGVEVQNALTQYIKNPKPADIDKIEKQHDEELRKIGQKLTVSEALNKQIEPLKKSNQEQENEIKILKKEIDHFQNLEKNIEQLQNQHDKLRNKHDHLQERFNKSQKELNSLERENSDLRVVVAKIEKMSLWERVLNRLPGEVKELTGNDG